ncbi:MAG: hypothetical protein QXE79_04715 [Candidatus Bathyarchaeia archaeon]
MKTEGGAGAEEITEKRPISLSLMDLRRTILGPAKTPMKEKTQEEIRRRKIQLLEKAIDDVFHQARSMNGAVKKGGGEPTKARYYRLMGYLIQVLDGVLKNLELDEVKRRLEKVEEAMENIQGHQGEA